MSLAELQPQQCSTEVPELITLENATNEVLSQVLDRAYIDYTYLAGGKLAAVILPRVVSIEVVPRSGGWVRLESVVRVPREVRQSTLIESANLVNLNSTIARASVILDSHSVELSYELALNQGITPRAFIACIHQFCRAADVYYSMQEEFWKDITRYVAGVRRQFEAG